MNNSRLFCCFTLFLTPSLMKTDLHPFITPIYRVRCQKERIWEKKLLSKFSKKFSVLTISGRPVSCLKPHNSDVQIIVWCIGTH